MLDRQPYPAILLLHDQNTSLKAEGQFFDVCIVLFKLQAKVNEFLVITLHIMQPNNNRIASIIRTSLLTVHFPVQLVTLLKIHNCPLLIP